MKWKEKKNVASNIGVTEQLILKKRIIKLISIFTPHAQREWGKVIGCGVHIYIYMFVDEKNISIVL